MRLWFLDCPRFDLEIHQEVVCQDDQLLPGAVGTILVRRDRVEGQAAFELAYGLLVRPTAAHETPECSCSEGKVGCDRRVFPGPVVRIEQIQLVVLPGRMMHSLSEDTNADLSSPRIDGDGGEEAGDVILDTLPALAAPDLPLKVQATPERDLQGVACFSRLHQLQDFALEVGSVHPEAEFVSRIEDLLDLSEELTQERQRCLAVVDVAGAVFHPKHVTAFGQTGADRVVTGHLAVVGIVAPEGPTHFKTRRQHAPVDVKRQRLGRQISGQEPQRSNQR